MLKHLLGQIFLIFNFVFSCHFFNSNAQQLSLVSPIEGLVNETSGLSYLNNKLYTHNDSGGEAKIYEIDVLNGNVIRTVFIQNATNIDWEDVTTDDEFIYIGDFGNNSGSRTNLKIYKVNQAEFLTAPNDTVSSEIIDFQYSDQVSFTPSQFSTNYDAEAFISANDSLYIFTKNWGNLKTYVYTLPKTIGTHNANKIDSLNTNFLVTGAALSPNYQNLALVGYDLLVNPKLMRIEGLTFPEFDFTSSNVLALTAPSSYSKQIEGVTFVSATKLFISSELHTSGSSGLYELVAFSSLGVNEEELVDLRIFPNPTKDILNISGNTSFQEFEIFDVYGRLIYRRTFLDNEKEFTINLKSIVDLAGVFTLVFKLQDTNIIRKIMLN